MLPEIFSVRDADWTVDPSIEAVTCKINLAEFVLANILAHNNFIWAKKSNYPCRNFDNQNLLFFIL